MDAKRVNPMQRVKVKNYCVQAQAAKSQNALREQVVADLEKQGLYYEFGTGAMIDCVFVKENS